MRTKPTVVPIRIIFTAMSFGGVHRRIFKWNDYDDKPTM